MQDLFSQQDAVLSPLADRMRPRTLDEFIGQRHIVGPGRLLRRAIEADRMTSSIFYGPPGCGKTTLASIIANTTHSAFVQLNAVTSGVADVRKVIKEAQDRRSLYGQATYLLLDECHRWSKSQSDSILPAIERGVVRFIGSTTENPLVAMTPAIVSRCRIFQFEPLTEADVLLAMERALSDRERGFGGKNVILDPDAARHIARIANGDVRSALGALELAVLTTDPDDSGAIHVTLAVAEESIQKPVIRCDESLYYDMLSAFCKSLRGSDADAALAWFARLLYAGVDPRLIARRIIAHASEDVGLANPTAMLQAVAAAQALEMVGLPEARLSLAQAIIAVCESPKSNSVVMALDQSVADAEKGGFGPVPAYLRDTHYSGNERVGAKGEQYKYPHDYPGHYVQQEYMPPEVRGRRYYIPSDQGQELKLRERRRARGVIDP
ncbi:MAG: replication-associated recombination protein A [Candidatus Ventricola sp.]|nr:replication-associated recombination protein A [Candidatus Ventricola sp.]MDY3831151.1 replication-associated recombination protein A [Candidatus Ventricola sp.]